MNEEIILEKFAERFSELVKNSSIDIPKLAEMLGIKSKSTIYRYMNKEMAPKIPTVKYASEIFNVNPLWLMGYDVPKERNSDDILRKIGAIPLSNIKTAPIPILGTVKAGYNYLAQENIIGSISFEVDGVDKENYYALYVTGDSMTPLFDDGDIIIVHKQEDFRNGENCIVLINREEATVKQVYKGTDGIELKAVNPYYPPRIFNKEEIKKLPVKVIGVVEKSIRNFKKK